METAKDLPRRRLLKLNRETTSQMTQEQLEALVGGRPGHERPEETVGCPNSAEECASITDCSFFFDIC